MATGNCWLFALSDTTQVIENRIVLLALPYRAATIL